MTKVTFIVKLLTSNMQYCELNSKMMTYFNTLPIVKTFL